MEQHDFVEGDDWFTESSLFMKHRVALSFLQESTTVPYPERIIRDGEIRFACTSLNIPAKCICIYIYIQGVPGGKDLTPGGCSLGQTIPI